MSTISYPVNRSVRNKTEDHRLLTENFSIAIVVMIAIADSAARF
jgi:hypothetical protein